MALPVQQSTARMTETAILAVLPILLHMLIAEDSDIALQPLLMRGLLIIDGLLTSASQSA